VHSILISRKYKVHITFKNKEYIILIVCKSKLTKFSNISNSILVVNKDGAAIV